MDTLWQDLRYGLRMLIKNPGFTAVAVLALALGIGANSAIFSVVNAVLLRSLPFREPERLLSVWETDQQKGGRTSVTPGNFFDWREQNRALEGMAAFTSWQPNLTGSNQPERMAGALVSPNLFSLLGVPAVRGRTLLAEEEKPGNRVVVLSHGLWQRRFGSDPRIIGQTITLNGNGFTVVGVMPADFQFPLPNTMRGSGELAGSAELWAPLAFDRARLQRSHHYLAVIARLKPGVAFKQAQAEMDTISANLEKQYPESNAGLRAQLVPLPGEVVGNVRRALLVLLTAVGFVLLIACANVANLLLARASARQKEIAIRLAMGATRLRLIGQLLTESLLLAGLGGALGFILALWGVDFLIALSPSDIHSVRQPRIDGWVMGFNLVISLVTGLLFGLAPALQASKPDLNASLKESSRSASASRHRLRNLLVVSETAVALVLLVGAGLMIRSFWRLERVDAGFNPENVITAQLNLPATKYRGQRDWAAFYHQAIERVAALPGVQSVGAVSHLPLSGSDAAFTVTIEGRPAAQSGEGRWTEIRAASPDYFRALGIPILRGRAFTAQDREQATEVIIINEAMARRDWPTEDPLGRRLSFDDRDGRPIWREVVGVAKDVRHIGLEQESLPQMYLPYAQITTSFMTLVVRTSSDPARMAAAVRQEVLAIDRDQPVYNIRTMQQLVSESVAGPRFTMLLLAIFAGVALLLASVGIYGVMSYAVSQRTREIGVRMALGARPRDVLRLVVGQGMILALVGVLIGLPAAFALTRLMAGLLFEVSAHDPAVFALIALLLSSVALVACYLPARRAMKVDPMVALRYE